MTDDTNNPAPAPQAEAAPEAKAAAKPVAFDLDEIKAVDTAEMTIKRPDGTPTPWIWTIAGPGHPKTIALQKRVSEEVLARSKAQEASRVNGRKWKGDNETAEDVKRRNIGQLAERVLGWGPAEVSIAGEPLPFSRENVIRVLMDPSRGSGIISQLDEFFSDDRSFMKPSDKT